MKKYDGASDIDREHALRILREAPMRVEEYEMGEPWYTKTVKLTRAKILYADVWRELLRTDDLDDVCTGHCQNLTLEQWRNWAVKRCWLGARIGPKRFAVIDANTDG